MERRTMNTMSSMFPQSMPPYSYPPYYQSTMPVPLSHAAPGPEPLRSMNYQPTMHIPQPVVTPGPEHLRPNTCYLQVRQQPIEALVTVKGKEKFRKPVDPPPIVELKLTNGVDPSNTFLQNPYIFLSVSLYKADVDEPVEFTPNDSLAGTLVSSLHRLKDIDNKDGGFFVFGDISVKVQGSYRLHFTMYEFLPSQGEFQSIHSISSDKFNVVLPKDFKGLDESTYLSRAFSDQGVRLRLRKEARGMMNNKRSFQGDTEPTQQAPIAPSYEYQTTKRRKEEYVDSPVIPTSTPRINSSMLMAPYSYQSYSAYNSYNQLPYTQQPTQDYSLAPPFEPHNDGS
ncbi:hypothetical protein ACET3X_001715 [Alternaria dauci]|uniref:Velvet domain-containing protein n=1 Tax=Alternaria dauci TaxID=48095 RepID=A0ABR3UZ60_9PLEO